MAVTGTIEVEQRRRALAERLADGGALQLSAAAREWGVHQMTIRRDFDAFVSRGLARRVRGGVIALTGEDFSHRLHVNAAAKRTIAAKLRPLVQSDTVIALDSSTTIGTFAEALSGVERLTVVTNGLRAFKTLHGRPGIHALLTGGEQEDENESLVGSLAQNAVQQFVVDTAFISTMSLDPDFGTSEMTLAQAAFKRTLVAAATRTVLALDATKLATKARVRALQLPDHDILVTELDPADPRLDPYRDGIDQIL